MRLYLTGFMGSGKTTIGRLLSEKLDYVFCDLDVDVERSEGLTIQEIFVQHGEAYFRKQERLCLHRLRSDSIVVATGGGCFIHNNKWMLENGTVIFLDVPLETLVERVGGDPSRPLWRNAEKLYTERRGNYRKAHFTVSAVGSPADVAQEILRVAGLQGIEK